MRISINLASRPFVELGPLFARLRLLIGLLSLLALGLGWAVYTLSQQAERASAQMNVLKSQTLAVQTETARNEARMRQSANRAVLERSQFLNALFAEKSFSWTAVMMDLEHVLPAGVQVTSIDPVISKTGEVQIRLRVTGDRNRAIQLVRNLERSQRFTGPRLSGETALTADKAKALGANLASVQTVSASPGAVPLGSEPVGTGVEFEIFSGYNPLALRIAGKREAAQ